MAPKSKIVTDSAENFKNVVKNSKSYNQVLTHYGIQNAGFIKTVRNRIKRENIDTSHFDNNWYNKEQVKQLETREDNFTENSTAKRSSIKRLLISQHNRPYHCVICKLGSIWQNKELVLQLDHINGINNDNRLENLRFLCPNCHSQTDTFCSKNNKKEENRCSECNIVLTRKHQLGVSNATDYQLKSNKYVEGSNITFVFSY